MAYIYKQSTLVISHLGPDQSYMYAYGALVRVNIQWKVIAIEIL